MRPVTLADIEAATQAVMAAGEEARQTFAATLLSQARRADRYRRKSGRAHPRFGDGTLLSAALCHPRAARPACFDAGWLDALAHVLRALAQSDGHHGN